MIPELLALAIALQNLVLVMLAGATLGFAASAVLRQRWNWRALVLDMCIAGASTVILVLFTVLFNLWQFTAHDLTRVFELIGTSAPAARRIVIVAFRRYVGGDLERHQ